MTGGIGVIYASWNCRGLKIGLDVTLIRTVVHSHSRVRGDGVSSSTLGSLAFVSESEAMTESLDIAHVSLVSFPTRI